MYIREQRMVCERFISAHYITLQWHEILITVTSTPVRNISREKKTRSSPGTLLTTAFIFGVLFFFFLFIARMPYLSVRVARRSMAHAAQKNVFV